MTLSKKNTLLPPNKEHQVKIRDGSDYVGLVEKDFDETEDGEMKVTEDFISELRALAKRQKAEASAEEFTKILGNDGKDVPKPSPQESEINALIDTFEIEEE